MLGVAGDKIVDIDIRPGQEINLVNPRGDMIPVAILSAGTFDAATVDPASIKFGATGTEQAPFRMLFEDVDADRDIDMKLFFKARGTGINCGDTSASLTAETISGQDIEGSDSIRTETGRARRGPLGVCVAIRD